MQRRVPSASPLDLRTKWMIVLMEKGQKVKSATLSSTRHLNSVLDTFELPSSVIDWDTKIVDWDTQMLCYVYLMKKQFSKMMKVFKNLQVLHERTFEP